MASDPRVQAVIMVVGVWGGVIVPLAFLPYYTWIARWWEQPLGRTIVALDSCILALRATRLDEMWRHGSNALGPADWISTLAMLAIPVVIGYRMLAFERKRRKMKRDAQKSAQILGMILTGIVP